MDLVPLVEEEFREAYAKSGKKVSGYTDTGVNLIAKTAVPGVASKSVAYGLANCWG